MSSVQNSKPTLTIFGCGYVGTAIARNAVARGMSVTALTRNEEIAEDLKFIGVKQAVVADLDSESWHAKIDNHQDFVLNCVSSAGNGLDGYRKSYINGQKSILKWAEGGDIGTYIYTSATSVYAHVDGQTVSEDMESADLSPSGALLKEAEDSIINSNVFKRWFILRLAGIYGPERHFLLNQLKTGEGVLKGTGDYYLNLIHRHDICSSIEFLFQSEPNLKNEIFNVSDGDVSTKKEIVEWLAEQLKLPRPTFDPKQQTKRAGRRKGQSGKLPHRRISNKKLTTLGWSPKYANYREGFAELIGN